MSLLEPNKIFSVTEISTVIKEMLEGVLADVKIEGEISGLKKAASGHIYFDIKDSGALISAVLFKGYAARTAELRNGLKILARGDISCYIKQGRYQLIVKTLVPVGGGDLYLEFEKLKQKLSEEGLFDQDRKKPLPKFANKIGIVTSPAGAALQDILSVLRRRRPNLEIIIAPTLVQGSEAAPQIADAVKKLNKLKNKPDVILIARGGGSMEDLWCFNEEIVARAAAASKIPTISCIGHETDFTITDFIADLRAPTPSAAAEIVAESTDSVFKHVGQLARRLAQSANYICLRPQGRINVALQSRFFKNPADVINRKEQEIDDLNLTLNDAFANKKNEFAHSLNLLTEKLRALNPENILKRGFSVVRQYGHIIKSPSEVADKSLINIQTYGGVLDAEVKK
ncbi:MAG: exodeoxyribonuclease VII large subunit [Elusimicrobium sp.]|jgi:exodeoxyribonuclease VII large subunit|nr:exodeoxyribonuclease VII large subunit [Elusimicrobium sp.]